MLEGKYMQKWQTASNNLSYIYIYREREVKLRKNQIRFQIENQLESNFEARVPSNISF